MTVQLIPGSPSHFIRHHDENTVQEIEIPPDKMFSLMPGLERLMAESRISIDMANAIIATRRVPLELAKYLGLLAHSGHSALDFSPNTGQCLSPLTLNFGPNTSSGIGSPINNNGLYRSTTGGLGSHSNSGCSSPMHQITKGISGLTTGGGSISKGTSLASEAVSNIQPLDLTMEFNQGDGEMSIYNSQNVAGGAWYVQSSYYDMNPLNLSPAQPARIVPTPPASPSLCIIQEEHSNMQPMSATIVMDGPQDQLRQISLETTPTNDDGQFPHTHPQICLTDVQGSEITLVGALSDSSRGGDSDDSLDINHQSMNLQGLVITEPSSDMPSITRGVGRKTSLENADGGVAASNNSAMTMAGPSNVNSKLETENYTRRGSDKSLGFSDDSLSNDSNNLSPSQEPSQSSGFKSSDSHSETGELIRLSPDSLGDNRTPPDVCYELPLPQGCSNLDSMRILQYVKEAIDSRLPPKGFTLNSAPTNVVGSGSRGGAGLTCGSSSETTAAMDNLNLEYSGGLQIELQLCESKANDNHSDCAPNKGIIKFRRISGDQLEYGKLCQQLISSLRV